MSSGKPDEPHELANESEDDGLARLSQQYQRSRSVSAYDVLDTEVQQEESDSDDPMNERLEGGEEGDSEILQRLAGFLGRGPNGPSGEGLAALLGANGEGLAGFFGFEARGEVRGSALNLLIDGIARRDDSYLILETLNELSEKLLMMNNLVAERTIPANRLTKNIVDVLTDPLLMEELELQLVACRCLQNLLDLSTDYVPAVVANSGIEALQAKLLEISYIDLAEQALQTLEVISRVDGRAVMRRTGLGACFQYLDFFTIHAQRRVLTLAANATVRVGVRDYSKVQEVFPAIARVAAEYEDVPAAEKAWLAISNIVHAYQGHPDHLELLFADPRLLAKMCSVVAAMSPKKRSAQISYTVSLKLLQSLSLLVASSPQIACLVLQHGDTGSMIFSALNGYSENTQAEKMFSLDTLMSTPKELVLGFLNFICLVIPFNQTAQELSPLVGTFLHKQSAAYLERNAARRELYTRTDTWPCFRAFVDDIYALLIDIYPATVDFSTRRRVLVAFIRIFEVLSPSEITTISSDATIVSLLASVIIKSKSSVVEEIARRGARTVNDTLLLTGALYITEILIDKVPSVVEVFERDGLLQDAEGLLSCLDAFSEDDDPDQSHSAGEYDDEDEDIEDEDIEDEEHEHEGEHSENLGEDSESDSSHSSESNFIYTPPTLDADVAPQFAPSNAKQALGVLHLVCTALGKTYRAVQPSASTTKLEHMRLLQDVVRTLSSPELARIGWTKVWVDLRQALQGSNNVGVSSYELISSGVIDAMARALGPSGSRNCAECFSEVFDSEAGPLLVGKLQDALTRSESFEVISSDSKEGSIASCSIAMTKQVALELAFEGDGEEIPSVLRNLSLQVQAIATFQSIEQFLRGKIDFLDRLQDVMGEMSSDQWHLQFEINGEVIPVETAIYGAIYKSLQNDGEAVDPHQIWSKMHLVTFRKVLGVATPAPMDRSLLNDEGELEDSTPVSILRLLGSIRTHLRAPAALFVNWKLSAKLKRQLDEPLVVASGLLPHWCIQIARQFPFLFPLETRLYFLKSTSFGYSRMLQLWQSRASEDTDPASATSQLGAQHKQKVRIKREQMFPSALKVLALYGAHPSVLEIEFSDEVGTGLGPTLEFYAEVSKEFTRRELKLWRCEDFDVSEGYVGPGLFPAPLTGLEAEISVKLKQFAMLGKFIAKSLLDGRIVDFRFNPAFFRLTRTTDLDAVKEVDPQLWRSLLQLSGANLEDLSLSFTLPGYFDYPLRENGSAIDVGPANIDCYIAAVVDATVGVGVEKQLRAFVKGFSEVIPYESMHMFTPEEKVNLFGGSGELEDWSFEAIRSAVKAAHGYTSDHPTVINFVLVLSELDPALRRNFVQFLTGSPMLPLGGFKALKPEFTIVLKHNEDGLGPDDYLPSVMTCANYLKLPNYSSVGVMRERMLVAINEGLGAFLLS
ncbi:hypothetical protein BABINDRAFT_162815 [Babjeviella inositovora NRRL Y-12698]|uniref:HECT-type E3 ubiquitin transferase n=1 Tax=Babjeviella inositovora NRRL Y-12698 TaxID=984486 RepID=A0A1E3QM34_9ASCO|nr:uncharacterized protein BABINDRAFT_162815 [Babjeviella inositovora NRRL Y-12698]ODQ78142.1 hypothetical protein BABINDRAFT_162815 [Babjeviella inositovora NRRL Y-12698]